MPGSKAEYFTFHAFHIPLNLSSSRRICFHTIQRLQGRLLIAHSPQITKPRLQAKLLHIPHSPQFIKLRFTTKNLLPHDPEASKQSTSHSTQSTVHQTSIHHKESSSTRSRGLKPSYFAFHTVHSSSNFDSP
ncbi:hypothetical protein KM043_001228 [Ampulex compressa]|nr:hypothetical protein KM043_001228 [Ampulex compressa]